jgi:hypothetical protein
VKFATLLFSAVFSLTALAAGGAGAGDGGHAIICEEGIQGGPLANYTVNLLDLLELKLINKKFHGSKYPLPTAHSDWEIPRKQICGILAVQKAKASSVPELDQRLLSAFDKACELAHSAQQDYNIPRTYDHGPLRHKLPWNCELIQVAIRQKSNAGEVVKVNPDYAQYLDDQELAALLLHEALHWYIDDENTLRIREYVSFVFSL